MELHLLTPEQFEPLVGERFAVETPAATAAAPSGTDAAAPGLALELLSVERLPPHPHRASPFALSFRGPREAPLEQRIHRLVHPRLGILDLFLVPIRGDAATVTYEAIFN